MEEKKAGTRKLCGKATILRILQEQAQSGQNIKSFCSTRGIAGGTFHRWKHKYGTGENHSAKGFVSLQITPESGLFAVVGGIKIYQPVSAAYLKELMS